MNRVEFFSKIENKYNIGLNKQRPIIIRLDARNTTKNRNINLLDESKNTFSYALKQASKELSNKYPYFLIYIAADEVNIIVLNTKSLLTKMKSNYAQEISSHIVQEFSHLFHKYYKEFIIFDSRAFSIYKDNINSYLIYRKHTNCTVLLSYYLTRIRNVNIFKMSYEEMFDYGMKNFEDFNKRTSYQKEGIIYYKGFEVFIEDYLQSSLEEIDNKFKNIPILDDDI